MSAIGAAENRDIAAVDITEFLRQVSMNEEVHVRIGGTMRHLELETYKQHIIIKSSQLKMTSPLSCILYRSLKAATLFR
jgi:hypothetical protein